jgi:phosphatidylglycerophosphate synthase
VTCARTGGGPPRRGGGGGGGGGGGAGGGAPAPPPARSLGALWIAVPDLPLLADIAARAATAPGTLPAAGTGTGTAVRSAVDAVLPALLAAGFVPIATRVRLLHAARVTDSAGLADARAAVAAVDEDRALLRLAVKEKDDLFTTYAVSTWSPPVTRACARLGLTPSGVTALSVVFAVAAALAFWQASRPAMIAGAVLLYLGFVLDCVDGQLARYTRSFGAFGGWLDTMADRAKEYVAYAGLAAGADRLGLPHAWPLAIAAMLLQTVRHMTDTWYGALHDEAARRPAPAATTGVGARLSQASNRAQADTGSFVYWAKRTVVFPIGERWALIAVLAAFFDGRVALIGVLAWGFFAAAYTLGLRSLRSRTMRVPVLATVDTARHRDDGPPARRVLGRARVGAPLVFAAVAALAAGALATAAAVTDVGVVAVLGTGSVVLLAALPARAPHTGALDWLVPAALRAAEYLFVVAVALVAAVPAPLVFVLLFVLGLHHYDLTARMEKSAPADGIGPAAVGWDGRVLLLAAAAAAGYATAGVALVAALVLAMFGVGTVAAWTATRTRPALSAEGGPR